jgi:hypothetical protein
MNVNDSVLRMIVQLLQTSPEWARAIAAELADHPAIADVPEPDQAAKVAAAAVAQITDRIAKIGDDIATLNGTLDRIEAADRRIALLNSFGKATHSNGALHQ